MYKFNIFPSIAPHHLVQAVDDTTIKEQIIQKWKWGPVVYQQIHPTQKTDRTKWEARLQVSQSINFYRPSVFVQDY